MSDGLKLISAVIAAGAAGVLAGLDPAQLIDREREAFDFTRAHFRSYRELPTVQTVFDGTGIRLPAAPEALAYYIDQVQTRHEYNLIRDRYAELRESLHTKDMDTVTSIVASMSRDLQRRRTGSANRDAIVDLADGYGLVTDRLQMIRGLGGVSGIVTGWDAFDNITGGYQNSDLITWVGRPQLGKTYVILRQALVAYEAGASVIFVTTEMGTEQIARRAAALSLGINPDLLRDGMISTHMERRIRSLCTGMAGSGRFKIFSVGMNAKVSNIEALCQEFGPSVVFVDGVYLLKPSDMSRNANRTERVTGVFDELRGLTLDMNVPFVVTSQLNRAAGKGGKDGSLETISFADAVGTHSSIVVMIKEGPTTNPRNSRLFDFAKGREGEYGQVAINFKFAPLDMSEMTQEEREAEGEVTSDSIAWMGHRRRSTDDS